MRQVNPAGLSIIQHFEGFYALPYLCPAGVWTIGFGHTNSVTAETPPITEAEAQALLRQDIAFAERAVARLIRVPLNSNQFSALVSWTFNLGSGALQRSTLRQRLNRGNYIGTPRQILRWNRAGGRVLKGLVRRRKAEAQLFSS